MAFIKGHVPWNKGKSTPIEIREKLSQSHKGQVAWNKGLVGVNKHSEKTIRKMKNTWRKKYEMGYVNPTKGIKYSEEVREKNRQAHILQYRSMSEEKKKEMYRKIGEANSRILRGRKLSKDIIRKMMKRRVPSSLEKKFDEIVKRLGLPYKFVGNGSFFIERRNPDFINTNGEKIAVEVYYRKHKNLFGGGLRKYKDVRRRIFNKYGWKVRFFNEVQVNENEIKRRL